jgi:hypothetical protein
MAITDLDQMVNTFTGGEGACQYMWYFRDNRIDGAAMSASNSQTASSTLWQLNSTLGKCTGPTGTARNPTRATTGSLGQANPTGGRKLYLTGVYLTASTSSTILVIDRLADISGLSGTVTTAQNTTSLSVSRYTGSESRGNEIWIEINTLIGTTATTLTVSYTNQAGTSGRTSKAVVIGGSGRREIYRIFPVPLANGDTGVRSVESVTLAGTTGTAGDFGVVILRPLVMIGVQNPCPTLLDLLTLMPLLPEIKTDACITEILLHTNNLNIPAYTMGYSMMEA